MYIYYLNFEFYKKNQWNPTQITEAKIGRIKKPIWLT